MWGDNKSWSAGRVPNASSHAFISIPRRLVVQTSDTVKVQSLTVGGISSANQQPELSIRHGVTTVNLTVFEGAVISVQNSLKWTGEAVIYGTILWTGSSLTGGGQLNVHGSFVFEGSTVKTLNADVGLYGKAYHSQGTVYFGTNKVFRVLSNASLSLYAEKNFGQGVSQIINNGTICIASRVLSLYIASQLNHTGLIIIERDTKLQLTSAVINGTVEIRTGGFLTTTTAVFGSNANVSGFGGLSFTSSVTVESGAQLDVPVVENLATLTLTASMTFRKFTLTDGLVSVGGNVNVTDIMHWIKGEISSSSPTSQWNVQGPLYLRPSKYSYWEEKRLSFINFVSFSGSTIEAGSGNDYRRYLAIRMTGASRFIVASGSHFDVASVTTLEIDVPLVNEGLVEFTSEQIFLDGGITNRNECLIRSTSTLTVRGGSSVFESTSHLTVYGALEIRSNSKVVINGTLAVPISSISIYGGELTLNTTGQVKSLTASSCAVTTHREIRFDYLSVGYYATLTAIGRLSAKRARVSRSRSTVRLSDQTHDVDVLSFERYGSAFYKISGQPTLRVNEYCDVDYAYVSSVQLVLRNEMFLHGTDSKSFVNGAKIVVEKAAHAAITTTSKPFLTGSGGRIANNGTLVFRTLKRSLTRSTGHVVGIHLLNNGNCSFDGNAWISGSVSTGKIEVLDGSRLYLSGRNLWQGKIFSDPNSVIAVLSSSRNSLEIAGNQVALSGQLEIQSWASVVLDVSPLLPSLGVVYLERYGSLKCLQNCAIEKSLKWNSGSLLMANSNTSITLLSSSTLQVVGGAWSRYAGIGSVIVQGAATFDTRYTLKVDGRFVVEGDADMYDLPHIFSPRGSGALINRGRITVHHGYTVDVGTAFENLNELNVRGIARFSGPKGGWNSGSISIPLASSKFIVDTSFHFEFANTTTISGSGTLQVEQGTVSIFSVLSTSRGFFGTVRVSGGTLRMSSTYVNLSRVELTQLTGLWPRIFLTTNDKSHIEYFVNTQGTFTATSGGSLLTIGVLELSGHSAKMRGDNDVRVTTFIWGTSARVEGKRTFTVADHLFVHGSSQSLDSVHFVIENSAIFGGNNYFNLYNGAVIDIASYAIVSVLTSQTFNGQSGSEILIDGELRCGGELAFITMNVDVTNNGRLSVVKGTLRLSGTSVHNGTFDAAPGTSVQLRGTTTFAPTSNVSFADSSVLLTSTLNLDTATQKPTFNSLSVSSGTLRVNTLMGLLVRTEMRLSSGTVELKARLRASRLYMENSYVVQTSDNGFVDVNEFHWLSGRIKARGKSSPWFVVNCLARLTKAGYTTIEDGTVVFKKRATLTETFAYLTLRRATLVSDGTFVLDSAGTKVYNVNGKFVNNGTFIVDVGGGKVFFNPEFDNNGWIAVKSGQIQLLHRSSHQNSGLQLEPETSIQFSGSDHTFDDSAVINCNADSVVYVTSGRLSIFANSSNVTFSQLVVSGGNVFIHEEVKLRPFSLLRVSSYGFVRFNASTRILKATLSGGTVVVPQQFQIGQLLMLSSSTFKGGRPKSRALLTVGQFIFSRGTIDADTSKPGRYFFVNVTDALTVASSSGTCIVRRADLITRMQAVVSSSSSSSGLYLEQDARLVNSRYGTTTLTIGRIGGTSTLLNYGRLVVETSGSLEVFTLEAQLVNTGGQVSVDVGQFRLNRGGLCNGTGGRVYVAEGARLLVGGNRFQCRPEIIVGRGSMEIVSGGVLHLASPSPFVLPLTVSTGGRIEIPRNVVGATFVATVTINGGPMQVDGMANVTSDLLLVSGSITGSGIVVIAETGRMTTEFSSISQSFSIANQVQNFGDFLLKDSVDVSTNGRLRNEKTGRVTIVGEGRIVGAGIVENLGVLTCRLHENETCQLATNFRNYKLLQIESGQMDLTSSPWLVDGSALNGPGRLGTVSNLRVGGRVNVDWTVASNVAIDGPLFSTRTCTWTTGALSSSSSGACTAYSPQSSRVLTPLECKEDFFVNEGLLLIDGSGTKQINSDLTLINRGVIKWKAGALTVSGELLVDTNSSMTAVTDNFQTVLQLRGSGHVNNKGLLSVANAALSISVDIQNTGTISLDGATLKISKTMTNRGLIVGFGAISGTFVNAGTLQSSGVRPLTLGSGSSFSQSSVGTLTVTVIENEGRFVSSLLDCTQATSVLLAGTVHVVWNATDALLPGEEGPPILTFGSGAAAGTFDAVTVNGGGGMMLTLAYKSTSVALKRN